MTDLKKKKNSQVGYYTVIIFVEKIIFMWENVLKITRKGSF